MAQTPAVPQEGTDPVFDALYVFCQKKCNIEIVLDIDATGSMYSGVRIRPFSGALKGKMVFVECETVEQGVIDALQAARTGKWRELDFAYRPWKSRQETSTSDWR